MGKDSSILSMPMGPVRLPVDANVVAMLRLPVSVTPLYEVTQKLTAAYGDELVIRTDTGIHGWLVIAKPEATERHDDRG